MKSVVFVNSCPDRTLKTILFQTAVKLLKNHKKLVGQKLHGSFQWVILPQRNLGTRRVDGYSRHHGAKVALHFPLFYSQAKQWPKRANCSGGFTNH